MGLKLLGGGGKRLRKRGRDSDEEERGTEIQREENRDLEERKGRRLRRGPEPQERGGQRGGEEERLSGEVQRLSVGQSQRPRERVGGYQEPRKRLPT